MLRRVSPHALSQTEPALRSAILLLGACLLLATATPLSAQAPPASQPVSLESAERRLRLYPDDPYAQFVALQLAGRAGPDEFGRVTTLLQRRDAFGLGGRGRREAVDLLNFTSGALAVQESLQLDTMTGDLASGAPDPRRRGQAGPTFNGSPHDRQQLQQLTLAMLNYESTHRRLPAAASHDDRGAALLSWRVHLLPFLGETALYDRFRLDEPWDSPHNKPLLAQMPDAYRASSDAAGDGATTTFQVPTGEGTVFAGPQGANLRRIVDGTSNTILLLKVEAAKAVPWTKPQDIAVDLGTLVVKTVFGDSDWVDAAMVDGSPRSFPRTLGDERLGRLLQPNDGQPVDWRAIAQGAPPRTAMPTAANIDVATLQGPTIKGHPFEEMLAGRSPRVSELARCVPNDFYFVHARSLTKLLSIAGDYQAWSSELMQQTFDQGGQAALLRRVLVQLGCEFDPQSLQQLSDAADEVAVVGSDLYLHEGSDVTLLVRFEPGSDARRLLDQGLAAARRSHPSARVSHGQYAGVAYTHVTTSDRSVHAFTAYPRDDVHLRSNSLLAMQQLIDTMVGADQGGAPAGRASLGASAEFRYVRTVYAYGAEEEDVLVYLSDPFIRRLMGPASKITEMRRRQCYAHLQMVHYATLLYLTEHGVRPTSVAQLVRSGCLPDGFINGSIRCPDGGQYALQDGGQTTRCTHHGCAHCMAPGIETAAQRVTHAEKQLYDAFLAEYNQYWRTFFDPIAIRIRHAPDASRVETVVLPLLDNSIYSAAAQVLGGPPASITRAPVSERVVLSVGATLKKDGLFVADARPGGSDTLANLRQIGLAVLNFESANRRLPPRAPQGAGLSWRVHILPYLEEQALYDRFRLDEPWDSPHNQELLNQMPAVYGDRGSDTSILGLSGKGLLNAKPRGLQLRQITDGLSNTLLAVDAGRARAVPWTKPADLPLDPADPLASVGAIGEEGLAVVFADGAVLVLPPDIPAEEFLAYATYNGGEGIRRSRAVRPRPRPRPALRESTVRDWLRSLGVSDNDSARLDIVKLARQGLGRHVSFHVCDARPAFSFNSLRFAGRLLADRSGWLRSELLMLVPVVNSLSAPVYVAWSLDDPKFVDAFLIELDGLLATAARSEPARPVSFDFYRLSGSDPIVRCIAWELLGFRLRAFYARVDDHLVIASQPDVIDGLVQSRAAGGLAAREGPPGHVQLRIQPQHWSQGLNEMRLAWGESAREACLENLGPLNSAASIPLEAAGGPSEAARQAFGTSYACPCGGEYSLHQPAGQQPSVRCSLHGDASRPRQAATAPDTSAAATALSQLGDVSATLTFTEYGLQAVFEVQRRKAGE
ncbi:hypothetical protein Pla175_24920 [Pirellulimonas nuda]|uniref:DUF1559 domain-containing protein n=1 Tax=Pirellulimonas nuda TaxID=2528009 RepID=A0A518DCF0_9BACT|nr:DUF1559 domain-containing protein [Pirellulimonas nuda]QDU89106.1 hypothetical protein Pla175_24920 [Pirellulimonas nuda]